LAAVGVQPRYAAVFCKYQFLPENTKIRCLSPSKKDFTELVIQRSAWPKSFTSSLTAAITFVVDNW
jgi:hypothetical protein